VQVSSKSAGGGLFEIYEDCSRERVTVVKFRVDNRGNDGTGCFRIEVRTDTADFYMTVDTSLFIAMKPCF